MDYEGIIIRPPSEAGSLILQVTVGCSHNKCTFCPAYKDKQFAIKPLEQIIDSIHQAASQYKNDVRRIFLCDGDPLIMPQQSLMCILEHLEKCFPRLQRVGIYGNAKSVLKKSVNDLRELRTKKLGIVYMGLESGDIETLQNVKKGVGPQHMIDAAHKVKQAGMKLNVTVILGLAGRHRSAVHARETAKVLNGMAPNHAAALTLMPVHGTPLYESYQQGTFIMPDKFELVQELRTLVAGLELDNCLFFSNHASNYFPLRARLHRDKEHVMRQLDQILVSRDEKCLRSESMRGL